MFRRQPLSEDLRTFFSLGCSVLGSQGKEPFSVNSHHLRDFPSHQPSGSACSRLFKPVSVSREPCAMKERPQRPSQTLSAPCSSTLALDYDLRRTTSPVATGGEWAKTARTEGSADPTKGITTGIPDSPPRPDGQGHPAP